PGLSALHRRPARRAAAHRRALRDRAPADPRRPDGDHGHQPQRLLLSVAAPTHVAVARLDELRVGYATRHEVGGRDVIVTRTERGVRAWNAICPHAHFLLEPGRLK